MKRSQVNKILVNENKRRMTIIGFIISIAVLVLITASFFVLSYLEGRIEYVNYSEKSNLDYKVYLRDNEFYEEEYLGTDKQYIANLIKYIDAKFEYELLISNQDVDYQYSYYISADAVVKDRTNNNVVYNYSENLLDDISVGSNRGNSKISKIVTIDYNKYNDLIKKFIKFYNLDNVVSYLNINMHVTTLSNCSDDNTSSKDSSISLSIPLNVQTVNIDMGYKLTDPSEEKIILCDNTSSLKYIYLFGGCSLLLITAYVIIKLIKYIISGRTAENVYHRVFKRILNNYKSYIQKVNNLIDLKGYKIIYIDTFTDLLEIRETVNMPILLVENKEKTGAYFMIPTDSKFIYIFKLDVSNIKDKMKDEKK